ncbi:MAG: hypothetical protein NTY48_02820 [Candidatus Diapherotrites archaeon]|nr:hypothetical protein [Candidatus Diapherotrites archaeon]
MNFTEGDDGKFYNAFTIKAAREGVFDFSIPGFLGASILAIPVFLLTNSNFSVNYLGALCAILIIPILFLLGKKLFKTTKASVVLCSFFALSPYFYLVSLSLLKDLHKQSAYSLFY